ncbi:MAG: hypothetical protein H5U29_14150 [Pusillimonas sp.]|nr:hypothetical protein [Pusillimonas sp.]
MYSNWPIVVAIALILLKQSYKLFMHHVPDRVDYLKAVAALPLDISFLIVALFLKAAMSATGSREDAVGLLVLYILVSVFSAILWRVSENAIRTELGQHFVWAFPLNLAVSSTALFLALAFVG